MAILCNATDIHLQATKAGGYTQSNEAFTVVTWLNATWSTAITKSLVGLYGPSPTPTAAVQIGSRGTGALTCWTWGGTVLVATPTSTLTDGIWYCVAYSYDGTTHRIYVNGVLSASATTAITPTTLDTIYINGYPTGLTNETSPQSVDSYLLYDRVLSSDELLTIANARGMRHGITYGLVAAYELDEGIQGNTVSSCVNTVDPSIPLTPTGVGTAMTYTYSNSISNANITPVQ